MHYSRLGQRDVAPAGQARGSLHLNVKEMETFQVWNEAQPWRRSSGGLPRKERGEGGSNTKKLTGENVWKILGQQKYRYIPML